MKKFLGILAIILGCLAFIGVFIKHPSVSPNADLMNSLTKVTYPFIFIFIGIGLFRKRQITEGVEYAESPRRAISMFIDSLIFTLPFFWGESVLLRCPVLLYTVFSVLFAFLYQLLLLYFLVKFGATPGKMIMGIVIRKDNFEPIGLKEALLRMSVDLFWLILSTIGTITVFLSISFEEFRILGFSERNLYLLERYPVWLIYVLCLQQYWVWSEIVVMIFNKRRKAIHDYIAGTVVIRNRKTEPMENIATPIE